MRVKSVMPGQWQGYVFLRRIEQEGEARNSNAAFRQQSGCTPRTDVLLNSTVLQSSLVLLPDRHKLSPPVWVLIFQSRHLGVARGFQLLDVFA
jgi:hypothetical protein